MESNKSRGLPRRDALKLMATAAAVPSLGCEVPPIEPEIPRTPSDPDLIRPTTPWTPVLTAEEQQTVSVLCDIIIPADGRSPGASQVGVPDYINEYVSAPYPAQQRDQILIRGGLAWLNTESYKRFGATFVELTTSQQRDICDDVCYVPDASPALIGPARFFAKFRDLVTTGFYTSEEGMRDIGYVGNVALPAFDGPPPEVLQHLNLE